MSNRYANGHTLRERLLSRLIIDPSGCLLWAGETNWQGYGRIKIGGRYHQVHRVAWELENGPIPDGLTIDHVKARGCRYLNCANVAHLEPVTLRENLIRRSAAVTHCPQGHPYDEANTYRAPDGRRDCRKCRNAASARSRARRRAEV